ncbi:POZ-, AT hook-, and zinc finger-containing protein 1 isoform X1 [Microcaecilia unicolor]|uniref:BTB/POZ domain zinc finger transcription factor n=1 Tax=Microcaecilia unicolor TaxID=1415580 RepID=A0A6P7Z992_9AMPH|nr:POZ-, AT hook-, and zinc finger-containing protein 1 isoform X1 [Microcaecilia unicolor]
MERVSEGGACGPACYTYQVSRHSAELLHNLNQQRKDGGRFCDVLLRVGDESFPAHRAVLAACSDYFQSVLGGEGGPGRELEMHTISSKVFGDILDFAYTSRIVVRLESFPELMTAAKFLLMRSVIEICQEVIKQSNVPLLLPPPPPPPPVLLRPPPPELGFPSDVSGLPEDGNALLPAPPSPQLLSAPYPPSAAAMLGSKRGRGRPRKANLLDSVLLGPGREPLLLPCGLCGKVFTDAGRLRQHEAQHGVTSLQLGYGELPPASVSGLEETPRKRNRTRKQVACELCGKIFRDVYHLNRHKLSHSGEKPYSCPVCGLRFKRKDRMSYHVRSHDGSVGKPYMCQSCGKGFSRPDHLNGHIKQVHTSERPHKCQTCNASFATRDRLRSHLACHEDKVPCQVCGKYLRAAYMADHLKKHSEGPSNFCTICNRGFSSASYLKVHVKTHHSTPLPQVSRHPEPVVNGGAAFHCVRTCDMKEGQKCTHQDQMESSDSYGELSDGSDLKTPEKQTTSDSFPVCEMTVAKSKMETEVEKRYPCPECGSFFRSKSYLNKHIQKVHARAMAGPLGDLGPALGSPFSPQQNMSLLESFGFQIVQSAFASSLVDPDVEQHVLGPEGK